MLHYLVFCGLQTQWWEKDGALRTVFWTEIMRLSISLLKSSCQGLLTPQEAFYNHQEFEKQYLSFSFQVEVHHLRWQRDLPGSQPAGVLQGVGQCPDVTARRPAIHCAVTARLPEDGPSIRAARATWAKGCDSVEVYVASARKYLQSWNSFGLPVRNLAMYYPVLYAHPDQAGDAPSADIFARKKQKTTTNLIRKALAMWHWIGTNLPASDFVCRLDPDTLFLADRFRQYVHQHCLSNSSWVYLGQVQHTMKVWVGDFPDGGAGICLPWRATREFATMLDDRIHKYAEGEEAGPGLPEGCRMVPGHLDDVITGFCFQEMDLLPHYGLVSALGQTRFNNEVLPRHTEKSCTGSFTDWLKQGRLPDLFVCASKHLDCVSIAPWCWVNETEAISFHGYKNASVMQEAYRSLVGDDNQRLP